MSKETGISKVEGNTIHINDVGAFTNHLKKVSENLSGEAAQHSVKIKSAAIKDGLFLKGTIKENLIDGYSEERTFKRDVPVHQDLLAINPVDEITATYYAQQLEVKPIQSWDVKEMIKKNNQLL